jgi:hypothetical protein
MPLVGDIRKVGETACSHPAIPKENQIYWVLVTKDAGREKACASR